MNAVPPLLLRVLLCGLVAGGVWGLLSIVVLAAFGAQFIAAMPNGQIDGGNASQLFLWFANLAAGVWAIALYAAIRPRFGAGPRTAALAGVAWWAIASLQSAKWVAVFAVPAEATYPLLAATLPAMVAATLAGAWFYKE